MANRIQLRRDTAANWSRVNPILEDGEPGLEIDTNRVKYGDGNTRWNSLAYATAEAVIPTGWAYEDPETEYVSTANLAYNFSVDVDRSHLDINGAGNWEIGSNYFNTKIFSIDELDPDPRDIVIQADGTNWLFARTGALNLPSGGSIVFPDSTVQSTAYTGPVNLNDYQGNIYINSEGSGLIVDAVGDKRVGFMKYFGIEASFVHANGPTKAIPFQIGRVAADDITLANNSVFTSEIYIAANGKVGINNIGPQYQLDVTGDIRSSGNIITSGGVFWSNGTALLSNLASTSYVDTQISNLVDNAPALLDTLSEIAANLAVESNVTGSILNSISNTNANVAAANVNINTLFSRVDQSVTVTSSPQFEGLTVTGDVEMTANVRIHQNLTVDGNINFVGNVTQNNITTANAAFTGDTYGFGALYAGVVGYTPLPYTVIQATADYDDYSQINFQNLNLSANASTEWVATAGNGTDLTNYIDFGIAGGAWNGLQVNSIGTAAKPNDGWVYVLGNTEAGTGGNLVLGTIQPGKRVSILTGGPGSENIYTYFDSTGIVTANVLAANYLYANGSSILAGIGGTYSDTNVEAYIGGNLGAFQTYANNTFGVGTYSNTNVAAYLTTATIATSGNVSAANIITTGATSGNISGANYISANVFQIGNSLLWANGTAFTSGTTYTSSGAGNITVSGSTLSLTATGPTAVAVGSSTAIPVITPDGYGRIASLTTAAVIAPAGTLSGTTLAATVVTSSLTTVGTLGSLAVTGNIIAGNASVTQVTATTGVYSGNITAANIITTGTYGNITGANVISANTVTVTTFVRTQAVTFATLPTAAAAGAGARAFITDGNTATFGSQVSGGGANAVPVYSNGTNWYVG